MIRTSRATLTHLTTGPVEVVLTHYPAERDTGAGGFTELTDVLRNGCSLPMDALFEQEMCARTFAGQDDAVLPCVGDLLEELYVEAMSS